MMPFDQLPEVIFDLLAAKSYQQLTAAERKVVDVELSAQDYDELHQVIQDFHEADTQLTHTVEGHVFPPASRTLMTRILHYPIPAYQVAATVVLLIGSFLILRSALPQTPAEEHSIYVRTGTALDQDSYPDSLVFEL